YAAAVDPAPAGMQSSSADIDDAVAHLAEHTTAARATSVGVLVWAYTTGRQLEAWLNDALEPFDLGTSDYGLIAALGFAGRRRRLSAGELSERLVQTTGGTTKTIQRLTGRGLVQRAVDPDDGRRALIELTDAGATLADQVVEALAEKVDADLAELDQAERSDLLSALRALSTALGERLHARR
ncbi:MAG: MarR family transcriptional regulator, partial [Acidimicrobiia bacterium]|nr:MarR family transcriptional regulator [Acidimicrobiia bacterium]